MCELGKLPSREGIKVEPVAASAAGNAAAGRSGKSAAHGDRQRASKRPAAAHLRAATISL